MSMDRRRRRAVGFGCERLESRIQLSTAASLIEYPADFMGPIPPVERDFGVQPMQWVSGITLSSATPTLGQGLSATLSVDNFGGFMIASTTWTYTISYGGYTSLSSTPPMKTNTSATVYLPVPGIYEIKAVTTYTSTNPSAPPPPPTTKTATATVLPPTTATPFAGFDTPIFLGSSTEVMSDVTSSTGKIGVYATGMIQERIPFFIDANGGIQEFNPDWFPPNDPTTSFRLSNGVLFDQVAAGYTHLGGVGVDWNTIPIGGTFVTYGQELRYKWKLTALVGGNATPVDFDVPLDTLSWKMVKTSAFHWELQRD
ncbi:hypothetical protein [Planctomyces sp. SH-PL62]|uniref:hypothetical protein n=1 Tax=Planctomyces sp. SH-PL62 TaxID=1636152 RepID=UPI00078B8421|nr:hypothetical protein [Planctomyces sp. SH-PL62]AMV36548.1 hypothetical protein VT85_03890 [Planctomyces sp. SH-PL62]